MSNLAPGAYDIAVEGFNSDDEVIADGSGKVYLETGKIADVRIDLTMRANKHTYALSYNVNASDTSIQGIVPAAQNYRYRTEVTVEFPAFTRTGYYFDGWNTAPDGSGTAYRADGTTTLAIGTEAITLYAQWVAYQYTVAFDAVLAEATGEMETMSFTYDKAQSLLPCQFLRTGYVFVGWSLVRSVEGNETSVPSIDYEDKETVTNLTAVQGAQVTLYAKWMARLDTRYTVEHYKQNLGDDGYTLAGEDSETKTGAAQTQTEAQSRTYTGFTALSFAQQPIASDGSTVIKIYYDRNLYTVAYVAGGDSVTNLPAEAQYRYQAEVFVDTSAIARSNYAFYGYKRMDDGGIYAAGDRLIPSIDRDITLTAQWGQLGGVDVEIETLADLAVTSMRSGNIVTLTAESGFSSYTWQVEETTLPASTVTWAMITGEHDEILSVDTSTWAKGVYEVLLTATSGTGLSYTASAQVIKQ